ncbi:glycosyl hydrolase-related protein [Anaerohalosphaera lusitana]|uniref:glycoside hydrolase family 38 N-terminal domain-containing protein n=1 Tax=Anaerohalosphaera lusitana TaxID=1936003 RepID=UPI0014765D3C|nr:glycosyl hydrolase-related protein [Anaerohalosphaera lusitana]
MKIEKTKLANGGYVFKDITPPCKNDAACDADLSMVKNKLDAGSSEVSWLINGVISASPEQANQTVFLTNDNAVGGKILVDLGKAISISEINTYSHHYFAGDEGARAPQVYSVYGSRAADPDAVGKTNEWVKIAEVDSRPNTTGKDWGGIYGVSISDDRKDLGVFRYILFDIKPTRSPLQNNPVWTNTFYTEIDIHSDKTIMHQEPARLAGQNPYVEEVIVVFKTHFDIGFTDLARNVVHRYRTSMIDHALDVVEASEELPKDQQFVWTVAGWPMMKILEDWDGQTEERKRKVWDAFEKGRFVVHALPYTLHTESSELEGLVRGMNYSSGLCRKTGIDLPIAAKMTDVPSHSWELPTLCKHAGIKFLHLGCNPASQSPDVPLMYWWEGPDGSRLLTMYVSKDYGTDLIPPEDWPHKTWLAMIMTGDNHGPPSVSEVRNLLQRADRELPTDVNVRFGTLDDFAEAILAEDPELPVVRGDMPDSWIHGQMTSPVETGIARRSRPLISAAESLNTLLRCWGADVPDNAAEIRKAYDDSVRYAEHTWAINTAYMQPHRSYGEKFEKELEEGRFARYEESWAEKGSHALKIEKVTRGSLDRDLRALAASINIDGGRVVVYNAQPWTRDGMVMVDAPGFTGRSLRDVESGSLTAVTPGEKNQIRFIARDVPAMGYRTYTVSDIPVDEGELIADENNNLIENSFYRIMLKPETGSILSIIDKRTGKELVDKDSEYGFGQYLYERFGKKEVQRFLDQYLKIHTGWAYNDMGKRDLPDIKYYSGSTADATLDLEKDSNRVTAKMAADPGDKIRHKHGVSVTLYKDRPYIDIEWQVYDKEFNAYPEAGWISLPFKIDNPSFRLARLGGMIDPVTDIVDNTYKDVSCLNGGMAVLRKDGVGAGVCPLDSPLVSLDSPGLWRFSRDFVPEKPNVFVNLYNNMWGTNYRQWIGGSWKSCVRIWSFDKYECERDLITPSAEARMPLVAGYAVGTKGKLPVIAEGVELSNKGVMLTAFGDNPDGDGMILRLWEQAGEDGKCTVKLPKGLNAQTVQPCDLRGRAEGDPMVVENGSFDVELGRYQPASFRINLEM